MVVFVRFSPILTQSFVLLSLQQKLDELHRLWELLLLKISHKSVLLSEALILLQFTRQCEEVLFWIGDRESALTSDDFAHSGANEESAIEHVDVLQRKFDELLKDMASEEARLVEVNEGATRLIEEGHQQAKVILERRDAVNAAWERLRGLVTARGEKLKGAHEMFSFNQEAVETLCWIAEKDELLGSSMLFAPPEKAAAGADAGRETLIAVQAAQRKHEVLERDLAALEDKVDALCKSLPSFCFCTLFFRTFSLFTFPLFDFS